MLNYNDIYELLRKEKYSEVLQGLPKNVLEDVVIFFEEKKQESGGDATLFADSTLKSKKQLENAIALFKELILRRKKKLLNLAFVATETGIMKRDYETMLPFERDIFDKLVKTFEEGDASLSSIMRGRSVKEQAAHKMVLFDQAVEQFVDSSGKLIGPFSIGELANVDSPVADILVSSGKASFIDS